MVAAPPATAPPMIRPPSDAEFVEAASSASREGRNSPSPPENDGEEDDAGMPAADSPPPERWEEGTPSPEAEGNPRRRTTTWTCISTDPAPLVARHLNVPRDDAGVTRRKRSVDVTTTPPSDDAGTRCGSDDDDDEEAASTSVVVVVVDIVVVVVVVVIEALKASGRISRESLVQMGGAAVKAGEKEREGEREIDRQTDV